MTVSGDLLSDCNRFCPANHHLKVVKLTLLYNKPVFMPLFFLPKIAVFLHDLAVHFDGHTVIMISVVLYLVAMGMTFSVIL